MSNWNLPPGVTDRMIEEQAGAFDPPPCPEVFREPYYGDVYECGAPAVEKVVHKETGKTRAVCEDCAKDLVLETEEWTYADRR